MTTLAEAITIAYRSAAAVNSACSTRYEICRARSAIAEVERDRLPDSPERDMAERRYVLWVNYTTAQSYAMKFCKTNEASVKNRFEALWLDMGNALSDLPDWEAIEAKDLITVVAFNNMNAARLRRARRAEQNFRGNLHKIVNSDFSSNFEQMFDLFAHDLWAAEGMRIAADQNLDRVPEAASHLAEWDSIMQGSHEYMTEAMKRCCFKAALMFGQYKGDPRDDEGKRSKFRYKTANRYQAVEGLFALDLDDLSTADRNRAEVGRIRYR